MAKSTYYMGLLVRGEFRRFLQRHGYKYIEDKGWLDSQFVVEDTVDRLERLQRNMELWKAASEFNTRKEGQK